MIIFYCLSFLFVTLVKSQEYTQTLSDQAVLNDNAGKCLDVRAGSTENGANVQLYDCNDSGAQNWHWLGSNLLNTATGKCLESDGDFKGANVQLWACTGSSLQQWRPGKDGQTMQHIASGMCLDANDAGWWDGTNVQLWDCNDSDAQIWDMPTPPATSSPTSSSVSTLAHKVPNCITLSGSVGPWTSADGVYIFNGKTFLEGFPVYKKNSAIGVWYLYYTPRFGVGEWQLDTDIVPITWKIWCPQTVHEGLPISMCKYMNVQENKFYSHSVSMSQTSCDGVVDYKLENNHNNNYDENCIDQHRWSDNRNKDCKWYNDNGCSKAIQYKKKGMTANKACCICGGGVRNVCVDHADWVDSNGDGCINYATVECKKAKKSSVNGISALDACCICGGGGKEWDLRLTSYPKGRLQTYRSGAWYTVCGNWFWNSQDGAVASCKKLGYHKGGKLTKVYGETIWDFDPIYIGMCWPGQTPGFCTKGCCSGNCLNKANCGDCQRGTSSVFEIECYGNRVVTKTPTYSPTYSPTPLPTPLANSKIACTSNVDWISKTGISCDDYKTKNFCKDGTYGPAWQYGKFSDWADADGVDASQSCCECSKKNCFDNVTWVSSTGKTCHDYKIEKYCKGGTYGPAWKYGKFSEWADTYGVDASQACCECRSSESWNCAGMGEAGSNCLDDEICCGAGTMSTSCISEYSTNKCCYHYIASVQCTAEQECCGSNGPQTTSSAFCCDNGTTCCSQMDSFGNGLCISSDQKCCATTLPSPTNWACPKDDTCGDVEGKCIPPIIYAIKSTKLAKCLDVNAASGENGANVQLYECNGSGAQKWRWSGLTLINVASGKCLDGDGAFVGANVQLWECNGGSRQQWQWVKYSQSLQNTKSGKCVDIYAGSSYDRTNIQLWECNDSGAQKWTFSNVATDSSSHPTATPTSKNTYEASTKGTKETQANALITNVTVGISAVIILLLVLIIYRVCKFNKKNKRRKVGSEDIQINLLQNNDQSISI